MSIKKSCSICKTWCIVMHFRSILISSQRSAILLLLFSPVPPSRARRGGEVRGKARESQAASDGRPRKTAVLPCCLFRLDSPSGVADATNGILFSLSLLLINNCWKNYSWYIRVNYVYTIMYIHSWHQLTVVLQFLL